MKKLLLPCFLICAVFTHDAYAQWTTSGSQIYYNNGNVGIGTTSGINAKLHVVGPATGSGLTFFADGGGDVLLNPGGALFFDGVYNYYTGNYIRPVATNTQAFFTSGTERLRIAPFGYVGIGTTSPAAKLHISNSNVRETLRVYLDGNTSNYLSMWQGTGAAAIDPIGTGVLRLGYDQSTNVIMGITGTGVVSGNVGIGTTSPSSKLTIDAIDNFTDGITLQNTAAYKHLITGFFDGNNPTTGSALQFKVANNNSGGNVAVMTLKGSGSVGIGTTTPTYKLHVKNTSAVDRIAIQGTGSSDNVGFMIMNQDGSERWSVAAPYTTNMLQFYKGGFGNVMALLDNGNVGIGTTTPGSYKLAVEGKIGAREVNVTTAASWPDYVFEKNYKLPSLEEIKNYIDQNQHLPEVPSAKEVEKNGVNLGEMNAVLLKKIEELMLYVIELKKENEIQNKKIEELTSKK